jgi:hypothetical protein
MATAFIFRSFRTSALDHAPPASIRDWNWQAIQRRTAFTG